jgi:hypothetical protein
MGKSSWSWLAPAPGRAHNMRLPPAAGNSVNQKIAHPAIKPQRALTNKGFVKARKEARARPRPAHCPSKMGEVGEPSTTSGVSLIGV